MDCAKVVGGLILVAFAVLLLSVAFRVQLEDNISKANVSYGDWVDLTNPNDVRLASGEDYELVECLEFNKNAFESQSEAIIYPSIWSCKFMFNDDLNTTTVLFSDSWNVGLFQCNIQTDLSLSEEFKSMVDVGDCSIMNLDDKWGLLIKTRKT